MTMPMTMPTTLTTCTVNSPVGALRLYARHGELTGYAGGMVAKRWLLDHERGITIRPTSRLLTPGSAC